MKYELKKTHYELVSSFLRGKGGKGYFAAVDMYYETCRKGGLDPTYEQFAGSLDAFGNLPCDRRLSLEANIFYHLLMMRLHGEKIYYVTPGLAARLAATTPSLDSHFLRSPFKEIFVQIDPGLFNLKDIDGSVHPVLGFYVNLTDNGGLGKDLRVMVTSILKPTPQIPFNDSVFFFRGTIGPGRLDKLIAEYASKERDPTDLALSGADKNIDSMEEFTKFVVNVLLYVTSAKADLAVQAPDILDRHPKSAAKLRKLEQRLARIPAYRVIVAGANVADNKDDVEALRAAGSVAGWKLTKRVRVRGFWRGQWYGSGEEKHKDQIWIDEYEKGPEFADEINKRLVVE